MPAQIDFGTALRELKAGKRVVRLGWNGKGMWLYAVNASIAREGWFLERWAKNIFLYGPIEPPEMEGKK